MASSCETGMRRPFPACAKRAMADPDFAARVDAVRRFNRFYTRQIGLLHEGRLYAPFSLTEARVLYELAHREDPTAAGLGAELGLDAGYLSRLVERFVKRGLVLRRASSADGRSILLGLTARGRAAFARLNARSAGRVGESVAGLPPPEQERLVRAMGAVERVLTPRAPGARSYVLRPHRPGDMGWVVSAHGELYAREYGWDETFEALVAEISAKFIRRFDPKRERCWIAELDGEPVGSVFLVKQSASVGKLRLLIVAPEARGLGIGRALVDECVACARLAGYRKVVLWTNSVLTAARSIYRQAGFRLVSKAPHHSFGKDLIGEEWELVL
jgi:DNA-binding MarR family transcriptional regulator/GNAT superfamily N-acetyltransferase